MTTWGRPWTSCIIASPYTQWGSLTFLHVYDSRFIAAVDARAFRGLKGRYCAFGVGGFLSSFSPLGSPFLLAFLLFIAGKGEAGSGSRPLGLPYDL